MIKKTTGIAAILLLILGIAISIAKADVKKDAVKKAGFQKQDAHALALKDDKDSKLLLSDLNHDVYWVEDDFSKDLSSASVKSATKLHTLYSVKHKEAALLKVHVDLKGLVLEKQLLAKSWNKDAVFSV